MWLRATLPFLTASAIGIFTGAASASVLHDYEDLAEGFHGQTLNHAGVTYKLDPGTYYVLVDGHRGAQEGAYTLEYKTVK